MAVFVGGAAIKQLWLFWVAPILGGVIGGVAYKFLAECKCCKCEKK
jgi:aquaporin Z